MRFNNYDGKNTTFICKCECGVERAVRRNCLVNGLSKSCGCQRSKNYSNTLHEKYKNKAKTGEGRTRLHVIWDGMKKRCNCITDKHYVWYGERGIRVCKEWSDSFQSFKRWALENGYQDDLTIDRIDNDGDYEPNNCRWISQAEQCRNKRNNILLTLNGETMCIAEWAKKLGINSETIRNRKNNLGWSDEKTLTTPVRGCERMPKKVEGERHAC